jgi:hypothetical protein
MEKEVDPAGFEPVKSRRLRPSNPARPDGPEKTVNEKEVDSTGFEPVAFTLQT